MAVIWLNDLSGSINHNTPALLANNEFELNANVTQVQTGNVAHRNGSELFLDSVSGSDPVRGLHMYKKNNGGNYFHMVNDGDLYINGVSSWSVQAASVWTASSDIDMTNFINRHYFASPTENLRYAIETGGVGLAEQWFATVDAASTGTTLTILLNEGQTNTFNPSMVGFSIYNTTDGTNAVINAYIGPQSVTLSTTINNDWDGDKVVIYFDPKYIAANGGYMVMANSTLFPRRTYYTQPDSDFVNFATDYWITTLPPTGVASFGNGRTFVIFTPDAYMAVDPSTPTTAREVEGNFGCVSHRSIQAIKEGLLYLGRNGFNWLTPSLSSPLDISRKIRNDLTADALFNRIDSSLLSVTASGKHNDIYYCAVRDLTEEVRGTELNSAMFVIDTAQNNWKVDTYPASEIASVMAEFTDSNGDTQLYAGSYSSGSVFKLNIPGLYTDEDSTGTPQTVSAKTITKHYELIDKKTGVTRESRIKGLWFKYRSASGVTIKTSKNGDATYTTLDLLPIYTTTNWSYNYIDFNDECRTLSIELDYTGDTVIYAIGLDLEVESVGIKGI